MLCPRCHQGGLQIVAYTPALICPVCYLYVDEQEIIAAPDQQLWWDKISYHFEDWRRKQPSPSQMIPPASQAWWISKQAQLQGVTQQELNKLMGLFQQGIKAQMTATGLSMLHRNAQMGRQQSRTPQYINPNLQLIGMMNKVLLDFSNDSYFPSTQTYQLAAALLIENQSEFLFGVGEAESTFREEWEVSRMGKSWKGWGSIDQEVAKIWLDENRKIICARLPYKEKVINEIRLRVPKGKKNWNPDDKIWEFSVEAVEVVVAILTENFDKVSDLTQSAPPMVSSSNGGDPLLSLLDQDDIQKIHKMLSKKYHPDIGGDADKMAH